MKSHFSLINPLRPHREATAAAKAAGSSANMLDTYVSMIPKERSGNHVVRKLIMLYLACKTVMERDGCSSKHARRKVSEMVKAADKNWTRKKQDDYCGVVTGMLLDNPGELRPVLDCMLRESSDAEARPNAAHFRSCIRRALASNPTPRVMRIGLGF